MATPPDNVGTISRNSFWYVVDSSAATIVMLIASVPVARVMGPEVLGHYIYLTFVTTIAQRLANVGIPATACKYMAEYLARGQLGIARAIYRKTLWSQAIVAAIVTLVACLIVQFWGDPQYRIVSFLIVLSMFPSMINNIPAQANVAAENLRANIPASFANFFSYSALVVLALVFHWGLIGLACATFLSRTLEAVWRYWGVRRWVGRFPAEALPPDLQQRMFTFSQQNLLLLALGLVVWDRSELLFLKYFADVRQIAFYSLAFSITRQLLMAPLALSNAIGVTIFAQYGRDRSRLKALMENATRYVGLVAVPLFIGVATIAGPLILTVYGPRYLAVVPILSTMSILAIPRAFQLHTENLLQATESQGFIVKWLAVVAVVNIILDWLLIPRYGAIGAAIANGSAQTLAVLGVWLKATSLLSVRFPMRFMTRTVFSGVAIAVVVLPITRVFNPLGALAVGIVVGALTFGVTLRLTRCLEPEDQVRLSEMLNRMPLRFRRAFGLGLKLLIPKADRRPADAIQTL